MVKYGKLGATPRTDQIARSRVQNRELEPLSETASMLIGDITRRTGVPRDTIRYYERLGLIELDARPRRGNNYKEYAADTVERLGQIARLKELGFTLNDIRELLSVLAGSDPCADLPARIDEKVRGIDDRIRLLATYRTRLHAVRRECQPGCCTVTLGLPSCIPAA